MLTRLVCAVKEKKLAAAIEKRLSQADIRLNIFEHPQNTWQDLVRSSADVFLISRTLIPRPVDASVAILNNLPEKPITIILDDRESSKAHATLLGAGADMVLYSGLPPDRLVEAIETTLVSRQQFYDLSRFENRGRLQPRLNDFTSDSRNMQLFLEEVRQVVASDASLLLQGETGVGKEHLSRAIHTESHRSGRPFIALNMAAIPEQLMESELFGHEQGAFTGAIRSRRGAFELAHGGTLFLDEIGEMPLKMQSKLLRVLQDLEFTPVGGESPVWVDVRVIAATNKDLTQEVKNRTFRQDLYYRLGVITLTLPPLRERKEDIPAMAESFLAQQAQRIGRDISGFSEDAVQALCAYAWPGNVRELMNVIERAVLLCRSDQITLRDLPSGFQQGRQMSPDGMRMADIDPETAWAGLTLEQVKEAVITQVEKKYLEIVLEKTRGRVGEAARQAGIHPRGLYGKMKKLGIDKNRYKSGRKLT
ncbi:MAG TPA: sigma-54 dependent transcriptional regulator [Desulfotignum sp.]|nr:sigma-54 dependent transcriptional regulator [Desulfotignum sp.]